MMTKLCKCLQIC